MKRKSILICGIGGFVGGNLAKRLMLEGHLIRGIDIKENEYFKEDEICHQFILGDLRDPEVIFNLFDTSGYDEIYQLAADMGGIGYISGGHDADIVHNSALINLNIAKAAANSKVGKLFYSSSACIYPSYNQEDPNNPNCKENSAYPAQCDNEYGWEKLISERMYKSFERDYGLNVRIARFHNIFGCYGTYEGGKEKAPAAICRKVAEAKDDDSIEIWGDGEQTRSFLEVESCIDAVLRLMDSDCAEILNIGSEEMISINDLAKMIIRISGKNLTIKNIPGPTGVRGRNSDNTLYREKIGWAVSEPLEKGIIKLYHWVNQQVNG